MSATSSTVSRRAQKQAANREALVNAAVGAIAQHGYDVSLDEIASRAGLTKGAVYSNFRNRAELLFAAVDRIAPPLSFDLPPGSDPVDAARALGAEVARVVEPAIASILATLQLHQAARHDAKLRRQLRGVAAEAEEQSARQFAREAAERGWRLPRDPHELLVAMNSVIMGLALSRVVLDQPVPDDLFGWCLERLLAPTPDGPSRPTS